MARERPAGADDTVFEPTAGPNAPASAASPQAARNAGAAHSKAHAVASGFSPGRREPPAAPLIFVIDRDRDTALSLRDVLRDGVPGARVHPFLSPIKALEALLHEPADLIVVEDDLGTMDCFRFLDQAARAAPQASRILVAATLTNLGSADLRRHGLAATVEKPPSPARLVQAATAALY